MLKKISFILIGVMTVSFFSCTKDFEKINVNPTLTSDLDPGYLLSTAELNAAVNNYHYGAEIVQQINTPFTGVLEGGNHNIVYDPNSNAIFNGLYNPSVKNLTDIITRTENNPDRSNLYNIARIMKAYVFQVLVDTYGDVPYFNAGKAFINADYQPVYDEQAVIYQDLLNEVSDAVNKLDASKKSVDQDIFYGGDIGQWTRMGNSLLLRIAMRYTKIDPDKAKQFVIQAVDPSRGGVMMSNEDNVIVRYNGAFPNPLSGPFLGGERANYFVGAPFIDYLKTTGDPRIRVIAILYDNPAAPTGGNGDTNPNNQIGMPYGYTNVSIVDAPGFPGSIGNSFKYSQFNRKTVLSLTAPKFLITYGQTQLLLAEAVKRQWISGNAADYYEKGVRASMEQMAEYGELADIAETDIQNFLTLNPYDAADAFEQINSQYWVASFLNSSEAWANFRRSGYPQLAPNPYPSADPSVKGDFIRRLVYPAREKSVNASNVEAASTRIGGDQLGTRLFWDKQ